MMKNRPALAVRGAVGTGNMGGLTAHLNPEPSLSATFPTSRLIRYYGLSASAARTLAELAGWVAPL
ncbi:hypothetical protein VH569_22675 [Azospirillum sp. 11R-A]|uniref:hypothetical protein n=1 Tax=Azospirillum sp. 11R-A TaxID=3111634 RepID=UPI003C16CE7C